jgi:hypothetical protein
MKFGITFLILLFPICHSLMAQENLPDIDSQKADSIQSQTIDREAAKTVIIQKIIRPEKLDHDVLAYLVREPLEPGNWIAPHGFPDETDTLHVLTWFSWIDDAPDAEFAHPGRFVFLNALTGDIIVKEVEWSPVLNDTTVLWRDYDDRNMNTFLIFSTDDVYNIE